jgi:hypothetical protein
LRDFQESSERKIGSEIGSFTGGRLFVNEEEEPGEKSAGGKWKYGEPNRNVV